jgi:Protein of unknown function (DUF3626)
MAAEKPAEVTLHPSQEKAIAQVRAAAVSLRPNAIKDVASILRMANLPSSSLDLALISIRQHASIALHFHPDRPVGLRTVASGLLQGGIYKSQYETGISNGSVSAHLGGIRDGWEQSLFNGACSDVEACHRPKYGALDLMRNHVLVLVSFSSSRGYRHAQPLRTVAPNQIRNTEAHWTSSMLSWLQHLKSALLEILHSV